MQQVDNSIPCKENIHSCKSEESEVTKTVSPNSEAILYEFFYCLVSENFSSIYRLDADSETRLMIYGRAVSLNNPKAISRFAVNKNAINIVDPRGGFSLRVRTRGESLYIAELKARTLIASYLQDKIDRLTGKNYP